MDRAKALALLPIITAYAKGLTIQHKSIFNNGWRDITPGGPLDVVNFSDPVDCYRLKPEPRYIYEIVNGMGQVWQRHTTKEAAEKDLEKMSKNGAYKPYTSRTYVEVLEDGT